MNVTLSQVLSLGVRYRIKALEDAHKWVVVILSVVFTPALLVIHLPVSLLLAGSASESLYACVMLAALHIGFAFVGAGLSPPSTEVQWLLLQAGARRLLVQFCLLHVRMNLIYWGIWVTPLLILVYTEETLSLPSYVFWLFLFTLLYMLAVMGFTLIKYRAFFFSAPSVAVLRSVWGGRYQWLLAPLGYAVFSYALLDAGQWLALRIVLAILAATLVAHGINATLRSDAEVLFWMYAKSCSRIYLLLADTLKGMALTLPVVIVLSRLLATSGLLFCLGFLLAAGLLCSLSLSARGRSLLAPLLAAAALGLLALRG